MAGNILREEQQVLFLEMREYYKLKWMVLTVVTAKDMCKILKFRLL